MVQNNLMIFMRRSIKKRIQAAIRQIDMRESEEGNPAGVCWYQQSKFIKDNLYYAHTRSDYWDNWRDNGN